MCMPESVANCRKLGIIRLMNKTLLIGGVVILLLAGVGGFLVMNQSKTPASSNTTATETSVMASGDAMQKTSLKSLMSLGQNQMCTFSDAEGASSGTMYIGSGKSSGDFESSINGVATTSHMVNDGVSVYFWTEGQTQGFKVSLATLDSFSGGTGTQTQKSFDVDKQVDYSCRPWGVDASKFTVPADVTFSDFSNIAIPSVVAFPSAVEDAVDPAIACKTCDTLPTEAAAQCRSALNCN